MSRLFSIAVFICCFTTVFSQTKLFRGQNTYDSEVVWSMYGNEVYHGNRFSGGVLFATVRNEEVYLGRYVEDCIYSFRGDEVYLGRSSFSSDLLYTVRDGQIYAGNSTFSGDILFTYKEGKIYRGDSSFLNDIVFTIEQGEEFDLRLIACMIGPF